MSKNTMVFGELARILTVMGPDSTLIVPLRTAATSSALGCMAEYRKMVSKLSEEEREQLEQFCRLMAMPISKQDQWYVATIDQRMQGSGEANPTWLLFRIGRCTGSMAGAIYGVNRYCSQKKQLQEMLCSTFSGNHMTRYGNAHEDDAQHCFDRWQTLRVCHQEEDADGFVLVQLEIENYGLCICRNFPAMAMSPDGFLVETWVRKVRATPPASPEVQSSQSSLCDLGDHVSDVFAKTKYRANGTVMEVHNSDTYEVKTKRILIEYKCPWTKRNKPQYDAVDLYALEKIKKADGLCLPVPSYYFAQCSYGMHVLGVLDDMLSTPEYTYFVVWHPANCSEEFPDFWTSENASKTGFTVAGEYGTIQIIKVPYIKSYCEDLETTVRGFWHQDVAPALWLQLTGRLQGAAADEGSDVTTLDFDDVVADAGDEASSSSSSSSSLMASFAFSGTFVYCRK